MNDSIQPWRFHVAEDGTITRGRLYRIDDSDQWSNYWDGDLMVAVYDDPDYNSPTTGEETERTEFALHMAREYDQDVDAMLVRLARRIEDNWDARFVPVGLHRGTTLYALSWNGDPDGTWSDEIEAVYHGDVWRVEVQEYVGHLDDATWPGTWHDEDDLCEEWYGENNAEAGLLVEFPLSEFPAEQVIAEPVGA